MRERLLKTIASVYKQKAVSDNAECVEMSTLQHNKKRHGGEEIIRVIMSAKKKVVTETFILLKSSFR